MEVPPQQNKTTIRVVGKAIIALVRMQKGAAAWEVNRKLHENCVKRLEEFRRNRRAAGK